MLNMTNRQSTN